jgi:hypothetical protein
MKLLITNDMLENYIFGVSDFSITNSTMELFFNSQKMFNIAIDKILGLYHNDIINDFDFELLVSDIDLIINIDLTKMKVLSI